MSVAGPRDIDKHVAEQVADVMFALSTPSRVQILACLLDEAQDVSSLATRVGLEQSAVSHQLRVLREHSLVRVERRGRRRVYMLFDSHVDTLLNAALGHISQRSRRTSRGSDQVQAGEG